MAKIEDNGDHTYTFTVGDKVAIIKKVPSEFISEKYIKLNMVNWVVVIEGKASLVAHGGLETPPPFEKKKWMICAYYHNDTHLFWNAFDRLK